MCVGISPTRRPAVFVTGYPEWNSWSALLTSLTVQMVFKLHTFVCMMSYKTISLASRGACFGRIGIFLFLIVRTYKDGMKRPATTRATMIATNMGKKMLIEAVVSIMITASEYVILQ
jgi:hypothetical protein